MTSNQIDSCILRNGNLSATVMSLGCITQSWRLERDTPAELILGYSDPMAYLTDPFYLGAIVGRVANRISGARFGLNGQSYQLDANEPPNTLHGGTPGLSRQFWSVDRDGDARVRLTHFSEDGAGGCPGAVEFEVTISLGPDSLQYEMQAQPDRETPINPAQHNYYSLGCGGLSELSLAVAGKSFTRRGADGIPYGETAPVVSTPLDFLVDRPVPPKTDDNIVLEKRMPAARLTANCGLSLEIETTEPCLQAYAGAGLGDHASAFSGKLHPGAGIALEPQGYPDALNQPEFPSVLCTPDAPYCQTTRLNLSESLGK